MSQPLVSIIMPLYNAERYVEQSIQSVLSQTFTEWELLVVNDCSTDNSVGIVKALAEKDERIKLFSTEKPSGSPTKPRNIGVENASGRYIAFLDSDDMWLPKKLEEQLPVFEREDAIIVFSYYRKMDIHGKISKSVVKSPLRIDYRKLLMGNVIGNLTGIYDTTKVGKHYFMNVGHEDYVYWLHILKSGGYAANTQKIHAVYRLTENSISRNKFKVFLWDWHIFRDIEHLSLLDSLYCFTSYAIKGLRKALV